MMMNVNCYLRLDYGSWEYAKFVPRRQTRHCATGKIFHRYSTPMKRGALLSLGAALLYGLTTPLTAALTVQFGTFQLAAALYLGAGLLLLVSRRTVAPAERSWLVASALVGGVAGPALLVTGLRWVDAATASLLLASQPVITALIAWCIVREHASRQTIAGMAFIAAASAILAWRGSPHGTLGAILVLGAAIAWAIDDNIARRFERTDSLTVAGAKGCIGGVCSFAVALMLGERLPNLLPFVLALAVGLVGYGVSVAWFVASQRDLGTARAAAYFGTAPLIGAVAALAFGARPNGPAFVTAALLTVAGITLHATERHRHCHRHLAEFHDHEHAHDVHHCHAHAEINPPGEPHRHAHWHQLLAHAHAHAPDIHHRHEHEDEAPPQSGRRAAHIARGSSDDL